MLRIVSLLCLVLLVGLGSGCGGESSPTKSGPTAAPVSTKADSPQAASKPTAKAADQRHPSFRVLGREAGIDFERTDDIRGQRRILEANGGGVAMFDFDGDGWLDLFYTNGCRLPLKDDDHSTHGELYRNLGNARFAKVTDPAQIHQFGYTHGCAVGDYDADGFDDLYVTAYGPNGFWRNNGDGTFDEVTEITGTRVGSWSASAAFSDVNGDEILDLYVATYLDESDETPRQCPNPASPDGFEQCPPAKFEGLEDALFLGDGSGRFVDATTSSGIGGLRGKGLGVVICDFNRDRHPEIYVANDGEPNFLFVADSKTDSDADNLSGVRPIHFDERGLASGVALSEAGFAQASMGIAAGDYDGNGTTDLFLTNFFGDTNTLYSNRGNLTFVDITRATRLGPPSRNRLGWGTVFVDVDNDGWLDLFVANGHVDDRTWMARGGEPYRMRPLLHLNDRNGTFTDVSDRSGDFFQSSVLGRGVAMGDLDRDGRIDLAVSHQLTPSVALLNETETASNALVIRLVGTRSNRNGYGASLEFESSGGVAVRDVVGGGSVQSASALEIHFGLGASSTGSLMIRWPTGVVDKHSELSAGRWVAVEGGGFYGQGE